MKDDVVERFDAHGEVVLGVHPLQRGQKGVIDLGQIAERRAGSAESRC
jgi:hypothetical protein